MNLVDKFKIVKENKPIEPYYLISYSMDSNDGDYIEGNLKISERQWKELPAAFFFAILYFSNDCAGKFSHGEAYGNYYCHHIWENKHDLSWLANVTDDFNMMCYTDWGPCHSYAGIKIEYFDEQCKKHKVSYPFIDDLFDTEEEMLSTIKEAIDEYKKSRR